MKFFLHLNFSKFKLEAPAAAKYPGSETLSILTLYRHPAPLLAGLTWGRGL